jgi:hypothetical protein
MSIDKPTCCGAGANNQYRRSNQHAASESLHLHSASIKKGWHENNAPRQIEHFLRQTVEERQPYTPTARQDQSSLNRS